MAKRKRIKKPTSAELDQLAQAYDNDANRSAPPAMLPPFAVARGFINPPVKSKNRSEADAKEDEVDQ